MDSKETSSLAERLRMQVLAGTIGATGLAYSFQFTSFLHTKDVALAVGVMLLAVISLRGGWGLTAAARHFWPLVGMVVWGWAVLGYRQGGISFPPSEWISIALVIVFAFYAYGCMRSEAARWQARSAIVITGVLSALLGIGQYFGALDVLFPRFSDASGVYSVFGNAGLLGGYLAIAMPLAIAHYIAAARLRPHYIAAITVLAFGLLLTGARSAWIACAVGMILVIATAHRNRVRLMILLLVLGSTSAIAAMLAPTAVIGRASQLFSGSDSGAGLRWWFWSGAWEMIQAHPIVGHGIGQYDAGAGRYLGEVLWRDGGEQLTHNTLFTEHPHNELLYLWVECGIIGLLLAGCFFMKLLRCRGAEWGGLAALAVFAMLNATIQSAAHMTAGVVLLVCLFSRNGEEGIAKVDPVPVRLAGAIVGAGLAVSTILTVALPSYALRNAQDLHIDGVDPMSAYKNAMRLRRDFPEAHEGYGIALMDAGRFGDAAVAFETALRDRDTGALYFGLAVSQLKAGKREEAYAALQECVLRWPSRVDVWRFLIEVAPDKERDTWILKAERFLSDEELATIRAVRAE